MKVATKTLALDRVKDSPLLFKLGEVRKLHQIGPYTIIAFTDGDGGDPKFLAYCGEVWAETGSKSHARPAVDTSLDRAILRAVALNHGSMDDLEPFVHVMSRLLRL